MLDKIFYGLFQTGTDHVISPVDFLLCVGFSLIIGLMLSLMMRWRTRNSESYAIALALLPAAVCVVIMMVNGSIGAGVAVAGTFSLVRFRSAAGTAREIIAVFIAMGAGLLTGMGYLFYALLFSALLGGAMMLLTSVHLGTAKAPLYRQLRITVPEGLNYVGLFDNVLAAYASTWKLAQVRTTNMGSMFRLTYDITVKDTQSEKNMLDELRCLNGNLEISLNYQDTNTTEL